MINQICDEIKSRQDELVRIIHRTELENIEFGSLICVHNTAMLPFGWVKGVEKTVPLDLCCEVGNRIGTIHSHPSCWLADPSAGDKVLAALNGDDLMVLMFKEKGDSGFYMCMAYTIDKQHRKYKEIEKIVESFRRKEISEEIVYRDIPSLFDWVTDKQPLFMVSEAQADRLLGGSTSKSEVHDDVMRKIIRSVLSGSP